VSYWLVEKLGVDIAEIKLLNVPLSEPLLTQGVKYVLGILLVAHLVHWLGDLASLNRAILALFEKKNGKNFDDLSDSISELQALIKEFREAHERASKGSDKSIFDKPLEALETLNTSWKWYRAYALFFFVGWGLLAPLSATAYVIMCI
jgi:hypothetical protein